MGSPQSLFLPGREELGRSVIVGFDGGYMGSYFHLDVPGRDGYRMDVHLAGHGHTVVTVNQFGVGDSTRPAHGAYVTVDAVAEIHHATCSLRERRPVDSLFRFEAMCPEGAPPRSPAPRRAGRGH